MSQHPSKSPTSVPPVLKVPSSRSSRSVTPEHIAGALFVDPNGSVHRLDHSDASQKHHQRAPKVAPRTPHRNAGNGNGNGNAAIESAVRLISETAHDLRSPLSSVAATMELIRNGQLGDVTSMQAECLQAALQQCDYLNTLVGEMLAADGLLGAVATLNRRSTQRSEIQSLVRDASAAVLATKHIELAFDGFDDTGTALYVDPAIVCRLLVNLIVNAERASGEGATILVRVSDDSEAGVARWSVIDCGGGISAERLRELAHSSAPSPQTMGDRGILASNALTTGTGLGLMISRQLAALHFSALTIRSRVGSGTDVFFETPLAHPRAVATAYSRFRSSAWGTPVRPQWTRQRTTPRRDSAAERQPTSAWPEVSLGYLGAGPRRPGRAALGTASISSEASAADVDAFDRLLQNRMGRFELCYRTTARAWVWVLDADHRSTNTRLRQIDSALGDLRSEMEVTWSDPAILPVGHRSLQTLLIDRMTTQMLAADRSPETTALFDRDQVRLGTSPIEPSCHVATRLDQELRRLSARMKQQSARMREQSVDIRP